LLKRTAGQTSERLSNSLIYPLRNVSTAEVEKTVDLEMADENLMAIILYDEFDHVLIGRIKNAQGQIANYKPKRDGDVRIEGSLAPVRMKILKGSEYLGEVRLYFTDRHLYNYLTDIVWKIILLTVLVSIFSILIIYFTLHRIVLTPVVTLQEMTHRLRSAVGGEVSGDHQTAGIDADEIELLGRNFDAMATELITSQDQLRHTAAHLQALLDETPDAVVSLDGNGVIINVNKTFLQMFGGSGKDFMGTALIELAANKDLRELIPDHLEQAKRGLPVEFEWLVKRKTADVFPVFVRIGSMHSSGDNSLILAVMTDITERKRAEEARRESEAKYRRLIDNLGREYFFYIHNTRGIMTYVSPSVQDMVGYTQDEFMTHYSAYLTDNPINREVVEKTNLALQGLKQQPYFAEMMDKSGCPFWLEVSEYPVFDRQGKVVAVEGIAHDVTARKLAEEALRVKTEELEGFFSSAVDLLCIADTDGYFRRLNREWEHVTGYGLSELEGRRFLDFIHPDDIESTLQIVRELEAQHEISKFINRYRCKDGSYRWLEWRAVASGKTIYGAARDITERIRTEEALRASESRLRAISDNLTGGMIYQVVFSPDGTRRFNFLSGSIEKMHEVTADEVIKDPSILYSQILEEDLPGLIEEEERCIREMRTFNMEARSRLPSGLVRRMKIISQPRRLPTGEILFDGVEIDITELKLTEQALRESEERFSKAFQANPAPMAITEIESGLFLDANDRWLNLFGYTWKELIGHTSLELNMHVDPALRDTMVTQLMQEGSFKEVDMSIQTKAGEEVIALWSAEMITLCGRNVMLTLLLDVTERKQAEEALRESEQRYRTLFDNAPIGISIMKPDLTFDYFNPKFTEMLGYTLADLPDKNTWFVKAYPDDDYRRQVMAVWRGDLTADARKVGLGERTLNVRAKNGQDLIIHFRTTVLESGEHLMSYEDVTELQKLNDALRDSEMRYRTLFEGAPIAIGLATVTGNIIAANEGVLELFRAPSLGVCRTFPM
nr:PAS domain S-box protein [Syntrophales bacterium]